MAGTSTEELGPWEPLDLADAIALFRGAGFRWWITGGHALEAHLGTSWRSHDDTDISLRRADVALLPEVLSGWDIHIGAAGVLTPWDGGSLDAERSQNNLWCRPSPDAPWALDLTIGDGSDTEWIYRRDPSIRRPWNEAVLTTPDGTPYLAPELQLLFKSKAVRPKDNVDAEVVIPRLEPARRSFLAQHLGPDHPWQAPIARARAHLALDTLRTDGPDTDPRSPGTVGRVSGALELLAAGRTSQAWGTPGDVGSPVVRVPIPNSGRLLSYGSEKLIGKRLAAAGHPVSRWELVDVDDVTSSIGAHLRGAPIDEAWVWSSAFVDAFASLLRDLHRLPATGWGPLADRSDRLEGRSATSAQGIVDRWFHDTVWPFDETALTDHVLAALAPDLIPRIAPLAASIQEAASAPFGVLHSDLHAQHLLRAGDELAGVLDFGDAFIGSTGWDIALLHWYYGAENASRVAEAYEPGSNLPARGALLGVAVGCYKVAKNPHDPALITKLRTLLDAPDVPPSTGS